MATTTSSTSGQTSVVDDNLYAWANGTQKKQKTEMEKQQDQFLTMFITQLKHQDPMNPMDNAAVTSQMAQISTVTALTKLNETVTQLNTSFGTSQNLQMASLIGKAVLTEGSGLTLSSGAAIGGFELDAYADKVVVEVQEQGGAVVRSYTLEAQKAGVHNFAWDGKNEDGTALTDGDYTFNVKAYNADGSETTVSTTASDGSAVSKSAIRGLSAGIVNSLILGTDGVKLNVTGKGQVNYSSVKQIV